jgi:hypothetical protein
LPVTAARRSMSNALYTNVLCGWRATLMGDRSVTPQGYKPVGLVSVLVPRALMPALAKLPLSRHGVGNRRLKLSGR